VQFLPNFFKAVAPEKSGKRNSPKWPRFTLGAQCSRQFDVGLSMNIDCFIDLDEPKHENMMQIKAKSSTLGSFRKSFFLLGPLLSLGCAPACPEFCNQ